MKKNKMMRAASALLIAVLMTTSVISGTFAKYVSQDSANDTARVAKWGVTVAVSGNLFGSDYQKVGVDPSNSIIAVGTSTSVSAGDHANVVAPGTENTTGLTALIQGTPEVAYTVSATNNDQTIEDIFLGSGKWGVMIKATGLNPASDVVGLYTMSSGIFTKVTTGPWTAGTDYYKLHDAVDLGSNAYYPIEWTVGNTGNATAISDKHDLTVIAGKMLTGIATTRNAGQEAAAAYTLTWKWPISINDGADTILGDLQAGVGTDRYVVRDSGAGYTSNLTAGTDYNLVIVFGLKLTVTQQD